MTGCLVDTGRRGNRSRRIPVAVGRAVWTRDQGEAFAVLDWNVWDTGYSGGNGLGG